jgi:glycosyltransferase involved in cell wall biosynthesis
LYRLHQLRNYTGKNGVSSGLMADCYDAAVRGTPLIMKSDQGNPVVHSRSGLTEMDFDLGHRLDQGCDAEVAVATVVSNLYVGGGATRLFNFARNIDKARLRHMVIVICRATTEQLRRSATVTSLFRDEGIDVLELDCPAWTRVDYEAQLRAMPASLLKVLRTSRVLGAALRRHRVDVVDVMNPASDLPIAVAAAKWAGGLPVAVTAYDLQGWNRRMLRFAGRFLFDQADALITDSQARAEEMSAWLWSRTAPFHVIPNGVERPVVRADRETVCRHFGLRCSPETLLIGQVGQLVPFKGQSMLLEAAPRVLERHPNVAFIACGYQNQWFSGGYVQELRDRAAVLGVTERFGIGPYLGPIGDVLSAIDIQVHPSFRDSSPIAVTEGMLLGKPVLVSDVGGLPELVSDGVTGYVIPVGDQPGFVARLLDLLGSPGLATELGRAGRLAAERRSSATAMARSLSDVFVNLAKQRRGSRRHEAHWRLDRA